MRVGSQVGEVLDAHPPAVLPSHQDPLKMKRLLPMLLILAGCAKEEPGFVFDQPTDSLITVEVTATVEP